MMSGHADPPTEVTAMTRGATDFLVKPLNPARVIDVLRDANARDAELSQRTADEVALRYRLESLSQRERAVMMLITEGLATKQVAAELGVSQRTVETHWTRVMRKMGGDSLAQLVRAAHRLELAQ